MNTGRSIAPVLAIVAFDLSTASPDRLPNLADQLGRALIETNDRMLGIGRLGVEIEHILHTGDVFGVDLRNAPHVLAPGLEVVFGQPPSHGLARKTGVLRQPD